MKRFITILLSIAIILMVLPIIPAFAANEESDDVEIITERISKSKKYIHKVAYDSDLADRWIFDQASQGYKDNRNEDESRILNITVRLLKDIETDYFPTYAYADINVDLNNHTWVVKNPQTMANYYHKISITGGTLTFLNNASYPIYSYGGDIVMRNVTFKNCVCDNYGLICLDEYKSPFGQLVDLKRDPAGSMHLDNVHFENCSSNTYASCVYINSYKGEDYSFTNCSFTNCKSKYGGALYFQGDYNKFRFFNCEFNNCSASVDGGAIYCESEYSDMQFTDCNAYRCHSDDCGGFIFCSGEYTVFNGFGSAVVTTISQRSNIVGCSANGSGGAFYSSVNTSCSNGSELRNFNIVSCTAGSSTHNFDAIKTDNKNQWGGAVCLRGSDMKLCYCDLYDNYAPYYGGAVYAGWSGTSIEHCTFDKNRCNDGYGNDLYIDSNNGIDVKYCTFYSGNSIAGKTVRTNTGNYIGTYLKTEAMIFPGEIEDGDYIIYTGISDHSYALDIAGGKAAVNQEGANAHLWVNGDADVFTITKDQEKGTYIIRSKVTGMVLDVEDGSTLNCANIRQYPDNGTDAQRWTFEPSGDGYYYIKNVSGQYMDSANGYVSDGNNVQSFEFNGTNAQKWSLVRVVENDDYIIRSALDERYALDIAGGKDAVNQEGANVHLWENGDAEVFTLMHDIRGRFAIKSKVTGLMLDVAGGSYANGANIQQYTSNNTGAQRWFFEPAGGGYYYIRAYCGRYMDAKDMVNGEKPSNDVNVHSWQFTGANNQMWRLEKAAQKAKSVLLPKPDGDGTKENPYKIRTAEQWKTFAYNVLYGETYEGKYIELTNDISISYVPVGYYYQRKSFKGHFDGKDHTVNYIDSSENWDRGLFSYCVDAEIKNVNVTGKITGTMTLAGVCAAAENTTFENCTNNADVTSINASYIGGICGNATNCKFISCTNNGNIHAGSFITGGIAANCFGNNTEIISCRNNGSVYAATDNAGGMVGESADNITIKRCVNNGKIEAANVTAGGMIGCIRKGANIQNCINTANGNLRSKSFCAGMLAWADVSSKQININNCSNLGEVYVDVSHYGGIVNNYNNANMNVINCFTVTKGMRNVPNSGALASSCTNGNFENCYAKGSDFGDNRVTIISDKDCTNTLMSKMNSYITDHTVSTQRADWPYWIVNEKLGVALPDIDNYTQYVIEGKGTQFEPYLIATSANLKEFANDIRLGVSYKGKFVKLTNSLSYTGEPIGTENNPFNGTFDGDGHTLTADIKGDSFTGLFGMATGATVKNLRVAGRINGTGATAAIIGYAYNGCHINNCHVIASVEGTQANVGGIVGMAGKCTISNCRMDGPVTSSAWTSTGGIVGGAIDSCNIVNCVSTSAVIGVKAVGGIVGCILYADSKIVNCASLGESAEYSKGSGYEHGGIVGSIGDEINSLTIAGCYSNCKVGVSKDSGLLIGYDGKVEAKNTTDPSVKCEELHYMKAGKPTNLVGSRPWRDKYIKEAKKDEEIEETINATKYTSLKVANALPLLNEYAEKNRKIIKKTSLTDWTRDGSKLYPESFVGVLPQMKGSGTQNDPYRVANPDNFIDVATRVYLGENFSEKYFRLTNSFIYDGPSIGIGNAFNGIFDGMDNTLTLDMDSNESCAAPFAETYGATIKNLCVAGSVKGTSLVAGIVGHAHSNTVIDNCHVTAHVTGTDVNCGGIAGWLSESTISNCRVDGSVSTSGWTTVGGIVGWMSSGECKVVNCVKTGETKGCKAVGGIVGFVSDGHEKIINCSSVGTLSSAVAKGEEIGGIIGNIDASVHTITMINCFANCKLPAAVGSSGYIYGSNSRNGVNDGTGDPLTTENLYYIQTNSDEAFHKGVGIQLPIKKVYKSILPDDPKYANMMDYLDAFNKFNEYVQKNKKFGGVTLTKWTRDGYNCYPESFVNSSVYVASIFAERDLPTMIILASGMLIAVIGVAVLVIFKKKKTVICEER